MTVPRFFISALAGEQESLSLSGADHHHLSRVLRARPGEEVWLLDGRGTVVRAVIDSMARHSTSLKVMERKQVEEERPRMHLFQAMLKGAKMDLVVEAAVELGVCSISPYACRRSRESPSLFERRLERLRSIALQSSRVAGRPYLPEITAPLTWKDMTSTLSGFGAALFADEQGGHRVAAALHDAGGVEMALVVGPEGGFEDEEREELMSLGARPVTLGPYIMRAEFAGMVLVAAARCACGLL